MEASPPPEQREDRGPRIPPGKITTIKPEPTISIFYKPTKTAALQLLDGKFPQDAAMVFCDRIRHELMDNTGTKSFTVTGGDLTGLTEVLAWIKQCVAEGSIVKYKDLGDDTPNLFTSYANVIISATYLGIPSRDLADGLTKRMLAIARRVFMSWSEVEWFYTTPTLNSCGDSVREVAAASVFWAWWTRKIDDEETPDDMMFLDVLRQKIPKLDQDLHNWCERNEQDVRKKWEEKKNGRAAESAGAAGFDNDGVASSGGGEGWDAAPAATGGGWDNDTAPPAAEGGGWDTVDVSAAQKNLDTGAGHATRGSEPNHGGSSGTDSAIDVDTGATTPAVTVDKISDFEDLSEHKGDAKRNDELHDATIPDGVDGDLGVGGGDWADEVNQHDTSIQQGW